VGGDRCASYLYDCGCVYLIPMIRTMLVCGTMPPNCQQPIQTQTKKGKAGQTYAMSYLVKAVALPTFRQRSTRVGGCRCASYLPPNCQQPIQTQTKKG